jgi:diguanylate cyclase (GGDEF)-like protein
VAIWRPFLVLCAALALPTAIWPGTDGAGYAYLAGLVAVVAGLWAGARRGSGRARLAWGLIAGAATSWLAGDVVQRVREAIEGAEDSSGLQDVFWLGAYPLLALGVVVMIRGRGVRRDERRALGLDTATVTLAAAIASWQLMIAPELDGGHVDLTTVLAVLYPLGDVVVAATALILLLAPGRLDTPDRLLILSLVSTFVVDALISLLLTTHVRFDEERLDGALLLVNGLLAAAALHPRSPGIATARSAELENRQAPTQRVVMLGSALFVVNAAAALPGSLSTLDRGLLLAAAVAISGTVVARFHGLVQEREAARARLTHLAHHDALTGLPNRTMLVEHLGSRLPTGRIALLYLDLDGFKHINDTYGHAAGDHVLQTVSRRLVENVRATDLVARLGGDEFVVGCSDMPSAAARSLGQTLVAVVSAPIALPLGADVEVGVSVGVHAVTLSSDTDDDSVDRIEQMLQVADSAMYQAKHSGGGVRVSAVSG